MDLRLIFVSLVWGVNFAFVKYALAGFSPMSFTIVRFSLSALFLMTVMTARRESFGIDRRDRPAFLMLGLIGIVLYNIFFMYGLKFTTASNSALFIALSPLFAFLAQTLTGSERFRGRAGAGLLISFAGVYLIMQARPEGLVLRYHYELGDALTLCAAALWALYTLKARPLLERYSSVKVTAFSMAAGSIMLIPVSMPELLRQSWTAVTAGAWSALAFAAFISGGVAFTLWYQGVKRHGVTKTIAYHYIVPFVAVAFAALFLGERITALQIAGGCLVLFGVFIVQKSRT